MERNGHLSESDEQLLELIREDKVDAEIGVRLGLGTGEVRERTEALAAKLGVNGKAGLRAWRPPGVSSAISEPSIHRRSSRLKLGAGILVGGTALLFAGVLIGRTTAPGSPSPDLQAASTRTPATVVPTTIPVPKTATVNGVESEALGQLFTVPLHVSDAVTTESQRDALAVIQLAAPGVVNYNGPFLHRVVNGTAYAEAQTPSGPIAVWVSAEDKDTQFISTPSGDVVYTKTGLPRLLVWVESYNGFAQSTEGLRPFYASVTAEGELWVSVDPIPTSAVIDINTGEALDVSKARLLGVVASRALWTSCDAGGLCSVGVSGGDFLVPSNGQVRCNAESGVELLEYASGIRLEFASSNNPPSPPCSAAPREVIANDKAVTGFYTAHALDASGAPISIAVAGDGKVYAGVFGTTVGCPCFPRN